MILLVALGSSDATRGCCPAPLGALPRPARRAAPPRSARCPAPLGALPRPARRAARPRRRAVLPRRRSAVAPVRSRVVSTVASSVSSGLSLAPFRALRPSVDADRLGRLLCPPYDVIDEAERAQLLKRDPDNAVGIILPRAEGATDAYTVAARRLADGVGSGLFAVDPDPAL